MDLNKDITFQQYNSFLEHIPTFQSEVQKFPFLFFKKNKLNRKKNFFFTKLKVIENKMVLCY